MVVILTGERWYLIVVLICIAFKYQCWAFFRVPVGHLYVFFGEKSIQVFCPFFNWVVRFFAIALYKLLYILEIKPLSVASLETIFSHSVGCPFGLFMVSLSCAKVCKFDKVPLAYFCFISIALVGWPKKTSARLMSENVLPMVSSRSFMVSCLMFKSLHHRTFTCGEAEKKIKITSYLLG